MALKRYAVLLRRWLWLIALATLLGAAGGWVISRVTAPIYESSTKLLIDQSRNSSPGQDYSTLLASNQLALTYSQMLTSREVLSDVIAELHLTSSPEALSGHLTVNVVRDTQLIVLTVESNNAQNAATIANAIVDKFRGENQKRQHDRYARAESTLQTEADALHAQMAALDRTKSADRTQLDQLQSSYQTVLTNLSDVQLAEAQATDNLEQVETAVAEAGPVRPRPSLNMLLGAIAGFLLALGFVFVRDYLDDSVKTSEQVEALVGAGPLATIAAIAGESAPEMVVTAGDARSPIAEAYRVLGANIEFAAAEGQATQTILVNSGSPAEGKTTTVANLAVALAQMGQRVIAVDTDLRKPTLHKYFAQSNARGLTTALLTHDSPAADYLLPTGVDNLRLLPSGPLPPNPARLVGSERMGLLIADLKKEADIVIFDSPPSLMVADAALLARVCDVTVLVVRAGATRVDPLKKTREALEQSRKNILGFVLNRVTPEYGGYYYYYYYHHYGEGAKRTRFGRDTGPALPFGRRIPGRVGRRPATNGHAVAAGGGLEETMLVVNGKAEEPAAPELQPVREQ